MVGLHAASGDLSALVAWCMGGVLVSKEENHSKAPVCAAFVAAMREVFGDDVRVLFVKENGVELGRPS